MCIFSSVLFAQETEIIGISDSRMVTQNVITGSEINLGNVTIGSRSVNFIRSDFYDATGNTYIIGETSRSVDTGRSFAFRISSFNATSATLESDIRLSGVTGAFDANSNNRTIYAITVRRDPEVHVIYSKVNMDTQEIEVVTDYLDQMPGNSLSGDVAYHPQRNSIFVAIGNFTGFNLLEINADTGEVLNNFANAFSGVLITDFFDPSLEYDPRDNSIFVGGRSVDEGAPFRLVKLNPENGNLVSDVTLSNFEGRNIIDMELDSEANRMVLLNEVEEDGDFGAFSIFRNIAVLDLSAGTTTELPRVENGFEKVALFSEEITDPDPDPVKEVEVTLSIRLDNYPEETSWRIVSDAGAVVARGGRYRNQPDGSRLEIKRNLPVGCYQLRFFDSFGDGICCRFGRGSYTLSDNEGVLASGGVFRRRDFTDFCVGPDNRLAEANKSATVNDAIEVSEYFKVHPNPVKNYMDISYISKEDAPLTVSIYDFTGRLVKEEHYESSGKLNVQLNVGNLSNGTYFIKATENSGNVITQKFVIQK